MSPHCPPRRANNHSESCSQGLGALFLLGRLRMQQGLSLGNKPAHLLNCCLLRLLTSSRALICSGCRLGCLLRCHVGLAVLSPCVVILLPGSRLIVPGGGELDHFLGTSSYFCFDIFFSVKEPFSFLPRESLSLLFKLLFPNLSPRTSCNSIFLPCNFIP